MKLKTLKDLYDGYDDERRNLIDKEQLKEEAIKWVKSGEYDYVDCMINFFNITAEDLE